MSDKSPYLHSNLTSTTLKSYAEYTGSGTDTVTVPRSGNIHIASRTLGVGSVAVTIDNLRIFALGSDQNIQITEESTLSVKVGTVLNISYSNAGYSIALYE